MARSFHIDLSPLIRAIERSPGAVERGARQAMDDIKDDWVRGARDIAPLDTGNLRRQIAGEVEGQGLTQNVIVTANASQRNFNYGYYIHELNAGGKNLRHPGTVKKFLDKSADEDKWKRWIEEEVRNELDRAGW